MSKDHPLTRGECVRVKASKTSTAVYEITWLHDNRLDCQVSEIRPDGKLNAAQNFDTSLLERTSPPWIVNRQLGDYVIVGRYGNLTQWYVRQAGAPNSDFLSGHDNVTDAVDAILRYQRADKRRRA